MTRQEFAAHDTFTRGQRRLPASMRVDNYESRMAHAEACGNVCGLYREAIWNATHWTAEARKASGKVRTEYAACAATWFWRASQIRQ